MWQRLAILFAIGACGGAARVASEPAPPGPVAPMAPPGQGEWAKWSHEQKLVYMKSTVLPAARALFMGFEPVRYAGMTCATCHGAGARDGTYKMPNPDLPKIAGGPGGFGELATHEHDVLKFMQQTLVPETAKLLGVPAFDMEKHVGFSCYQCHTRSDR